MWQVLFYDDKVVKTFESFPTPARAKFYHLFTLLETHGNELREPHSKYLANGLLELRVKCDSGAYRILYAFVEQKRAYLLHAFVKKSQATPKRELNLALKKLKELQ